MRRDSTLTIRSVESVGRHYRMRRRKRTLCFVCSRRVWLRKDGTVGDHKVKVYDGWGGTMRTLIGEVRCAGTGHDPEALRSSSPHQTCGWCEQPRATLSHVCKKAGS